MTRQTSSIRRVCKAVSQCHSWYAQEIDPNLIKRSFKYCEISDDINEFNNLSKLDDEKVNDEGDANENVGFYNNINRQVYDKQEIVKNK
ncbi:10881_t:CDS:2 [Dentiscutata erythropus]|uniref:10881_t:CDS:1 n=1 Tax=Dentiscutata erythropus TaxID=1348616 RepID=A0A9N9IEI4_9GLOM|nr:10881_t:CDS:2 [Dentiscutata erythropus]